jgi:endonuclease/exonuclease/phosphatase family metal-dependent hydrolase
MTAHRNALLLVLGLAAACGGFTSRDGSDRGNAADLGEPNGSAHADALPRRLKVASWNLEWLHRNDGAGPVKRVEADYARLRGYAERLAADVIALQEVDGEEAAARVFDPEKYELHMAAQSDPQRTGFAIRRGLSVTPHPDYTALDVGQVRVGVDITVHYAGGPLRLLSVHLKSACFSDPLTSDKRDCKKLAAQVPVLEAWIDARSAEGVPAIVLGDFNRRFFAGKDEPFWRDLDDAEPPLSDLWAPTEGIRSICWNGAYPDFIDHLVLNKSATALALADSFVQQQYDPSDSVYKRVLSDHCPLAITLTEVAEHQPQTSGKAARANEESGDATEVSAPARAGRIKGNIGAHRRRIYHRPDCPDYARTQIDERKGERWFDSEADAQAAGFVSCATRGAH